VHARLFCGIQGLLYAQHLQGLSGRPEIGEELVCVDQEIEALSIWHEVSAESTYIFRIVGCDIVY
jgi:hypothetical protein